MKMTQISVFLENTKGRLYDVCSLLGRNGINMRAVTIAESPEFGILRMVVDKPEEAMRVLKADGFVANLTDIVTVEVPDRPGGLVNVLKVLAEHEINVEYMYGFLEKCSDNALMVLRFDDPDKAIRALTENDVRVVRKNEIVDL